MKLEVDQQGLEERVKSLNEKAQALQLKCSNLEQEELCHSYSISIYRELEKMGMGIKQLKLLLNIVTEIATANNIISQDKANEKFFSDVQKQYDDKLGFELELEILQYIQVYTPFFDNSNTLILNIRQLQILQFYWSFLILQSRNYFLTRCYQISQISHQQRIYSLPFFLDENGLVVYFKKNRSVIQLSTSFLVSRSAYGITYAMAICTCAVFTIYSTPTCPNPAVTAYATFSSISGVSTIRPIYLSKCLFYKKSGQ
jgi:hypothetical protein